VKTFSSQPGQAWLVDVLVVRVDHHDAGGVAVQQAPQPVGHQRPAGAAPQHDDSLSHDPALPPRVPQALEALVLANRADRPRVPGPGRGAE
jgi:hypothetical protein